MLQELANGTVLAGRVQAGSVDTEPVQVSTSLDYVNVRLGTELTLQILKMCLQNLVLD